MRLCIFPIYVYVYSYIYMYNLLVKKHVEIPRIKRRSQSKLVL